MCETHLPDVSCKSCEANLHTADVWKKMQASGQLVWKGEMSLLTVKFADKCTGLHNYRYK